MLPAALNSLLKKHRIHLLQKNTEIFLFNKIVRGSLCRAADFLLTDLAIFANILSLANLAHLVEQLPRNEQVLGSSPGVG